MRAQVVVAWITVGGLAVGAGAVRQVPSTRVYGESPPVWFEAHRVAATISPNGLLAAMPIRWPESVAVIDLARGSRDAGALWPGLDSSKAAAFTNRGDLVLFGWRGGEVGWYVRDGSAARKLAVPPSATPRWSSDGRRLAYFTPYARRGEPEHRFFAGAPGAERAYTVVGRVSGLAWAGAGDTVLVMLVDSTGVSTLARVSLTSGASSVVAGSLDADPSTSPVAVSPDGRKAFVALSSPRAASPEERNRPDADRDLDIYEIDLASGEKRVVVGTAAEEYGPAIVGRDLYWTHTEADMSVVTLPIGGGATTPVVRGAMLPSWRPDGRALGFCYGGLRAADWVLNWEGGAIDLDAAGRPTDANLLHPQVSPDGRRIAATRVLHRKEIRRMAYR